MGCGSSSASGRDKYATLSPDEAEPLFSSGDDNGLPRLDSFIVAPPAESPTPSLPQTALGSSFNQGSSSNYHSAVNSAAAAGINSAKNKKNSNNSNNHNSFSEPTPLSPDPFDGFPTPKGFDTKPGFAYTANSVDNNNLSNAWLPQNIQDDDDDNISFPSLPDPQLASSAISKAAVRSDLLDVPPPPTPPSESPDLLQPPALLDSTSQTIPAPPIAGASNAPQQSQQNQQQQPPPPEKEHSSSQLERKASKDPKKKKKKRAKGKSAKKESSGRDVTAEPKKELLTAEKLAEQMAHELRPEDTPQPSSLSGMRFDELYRLRGVLGTGAFSTVREGYHRSSETITYAVKCVNRRKLSEEDEAALLDEVAILKEMKHLHIIRLYDFFVEQSTYYLVMERMSGGELFDRIVAKAYYSEKEARDVCKIVLEAVGYCHLNNVAHRDLKPENLLLLGNDDDSTVKIADFGFAKKVYAPSSLTTQCGTPGYVAPEILEGLPYDTRADMWSVGVILYILLGGYPPFIENNQRDLFRKIRKGEYEFHEEYWGTVTAEAKELISSLLTVDPNTRLNAQDSLENTWIRIDDEVLAQRDLGVNLKELTRFNVRRKFKAAVSTIMAVNKLQSLGKDFLRNLS